PQSSSRADATTETSANTRPGGVHDSGTRRASTAYPAKNRAFRRVNDSAAPVTLGSSTSEFGHVPGSRRSWSRTLPTNETERSPERPRPARRGRIRQVRPLPVRRAVVTHIREPNIAYTTGVTCGPARVPTARYVIEPWSSTASTWGGRGLISNPS